MTAIRKTCGKRLPVTQTELRLVFKRPPRLGFGPSGHIAEPNQLVIRLDPTTGVRIQVDAHRADAARIRPIELDMEFGDACGRAAREAGVEPAEEAAS